MIWIFGDKRVMRPFFGRQAQHVYLPRGICHLAGDDGATITIHYSFLKLDNYGPVMIPSERKRAGVIDVIPGLDAAGNGFAMRIE